MAEVSSAEVVKSGETCIQVDLRRGSTASGGGLIVKVTAVGRVEEFMKQNSFEALEVNPQLGRYWTPVPKGSSLMVYSMLEVIPPIEVDRGLTAVLDRPGLPLMDMIDPRERAAAAPRAGRNRFAGAPGEPLDMIEDGYGVRETLNISFLRLVGISEPEGVTFSVKGVWGDTGVNRLAEQIEEACKRFYIQYLRPIRLIVTVSTMPMSA